VSVRHAHEGNTRSRWAGQPQWASRVLLLLTSISLLLVDTGCTPPIQGASNKGAQQFPGGAVQVVYPNTLYWPFQSLWPRLGALGYRFVGIEGGSSTSQARNVAAGGLTPDVFISDSTSGTAIFSTLQRSARGNLAPWYVTFGSLPVVVAYSAKSRFATQLDAAAAGKEPWYAALQLPGFRLGRVDPNAFPLNPRGVSTLLTMQLAEQYYNQPGLNQAVLGSAENPTQILRSGLAAKLQNGQLDAGFLYLVDAKIAGLKYITLPDRVNLSNPADNATYEQASCTVGGGGTISGAPITYSLTILSSAKNRAGADAFARYVLAGQGHAALDRAGVRALPPLIVGNPATLPQDLQGLTS
jgi:molybdate/tungstate transport system substrate-binding protein